MLFNLFQSLPLIYTSKPSESVLSFCGSCAAADLHILIKEINIPPHLLHIFIPYVKFRIIIVQKSIKYLSVFNIAWYFLTFREGTL